MSLLDLIDEKRPEILRIAAEHGARDVRLFGSVAWGEEHSKSDVDFLADVDDFRQQLGLAGDLERLLGVSVDVVGNRDLTFRERVLPDSIPLDAPDFREQAVLQSHRPHVPNDRDERRLGLMLRYAQEVVQLARDASRERFLNDTLTQRGLVMTLALIGEEAGRITDDFQGEHPRIPWQKIVAFRNEAFHDYAGLTLEQVWDETIQVAVPDLIRLLQTLT